MESLQTFLSERKPEEAARKLRSFLLYDPQSIRERFGTRPIQLMRLLEPELRFPKKIRVLFAMLWKRQDQEGRPATRFIVKGPRGGGKSKLLGAIGFAIWFLQARNIVDMGGSLEQAKGVYNYFAGHCYAAEGVYEHMPKEPAMQKSESDRGNYFKAVAASPKAVRGPHPDVLLIDEAVEAKDEIVLAALPMVNTSPTPLLVLTSTFHKIFGMFQETWDKAEQYGYVRYSWDIIDVCVPFSLEVFKDARLAEEIPDLTVAQAGEKSLEHRVAGRTGDPEGWVPFESVLQAWREKSTLDWFDVEYMGSRPSAAGLVNDPEDVDACIVSDGTPKRLPSRAKYEDTSGGIDWGFSGQTAWIPIMRGKDDLKHQLECRIYTRVRSEVIIADVVADVIKYRIPVIYADSSHPFENADLAAAIAKALRRGDFRCRVAEVSFGKEKEAMLGNYRAHFERRLMRILAAWKEAIWQHKRYRYQEGSDKPLKQDDHVPDATMLALSKWPLTKGEPSKLPDQPAARRASEHSSTISGGILDEVF